MKTTKFTVGQQVTVWSVPGRIGHRKEPERVTTVTKVGVRKMTLADGSEWSGDGQKPFGYKQSSGFYMPDYVKATADGDVDACARRRAVAWIGRLQEKDWKRATTEELAAVYVIATRLIETRPT